MRGLICSLRMLLSLIGALIHMREYRRLLTIFCYLKFKTPPTWRARSPYFYPQLNGWPSASFPHACSSTAVVLTQSRNSKQEIHGLVSLFGLVVQTLAITWSLKSYQCVQQKTQLQISSIQITYFNVPNTSDALHVKYLRNNFSTRSKWKILHAQHEFHISNFGLVALLKFIYAHHSSNEATRTAGTSPCCNFLANLAPETRFTIPRQHTSSHLFCPVPQCVP